MNCKNCGKEMDDGATVCPHCGVSDGSDTPAPAAPKMNLLAIIGLVLSIIFGPAGIVCSIFARKQCKERGENGEKLAFAGIIVGIVWTVALVLYIVIALSLIFGAH